MAYPSCNRLAALTALVIMMFFNPRVVRAFSSLSGSRRSFHVTSLKVARNTRGQMSMWGEGPNDRPSIPSSAGDKPRRPNVDEDGRRTRSRGGESSSSPRRSNDSFDDWGNSNAVDDSSKRSNRQSSGDDWGAAPAKSSPSAGGWDDYDEPATRSKPRNQGRGGRGRGDRGGRGRGRGRGDRGDDRGRDDRFGGRGRGDRAFPIQTPEEKKEAADMKTNLNALEKAGYVHLYGLAPVINALTSKRRNLVTPDTYIDLDLLEGEDLEHEKRQRERKPEAQFSPWLFVQENMKFGAGGKVGDKAVTAKEVEQLAIENSVPVAYVDKGVLNTLCGSRPHQGYILRCGNLDFEFMSRIPHPNEDKNVPSLWLVLDEVVDPQNFGALLRSAYFLGGVSPTDETSHNTIGIMVCSKNSAPPSAVVSAASAGALELSQIYSTNNLPRTLNMAREEGWRILGAAASAPNGMTDTETGESVECMDLQNVGTGESQPPTILVLGSEGYGLRNLVAKACTGFVRVPGSEVASVEGNTNAGVDSLNVSVTGGIMLWHFLNGKN